MKKEKYYSGGEFNTLALESTEGKKEKKDNQTKNPPFH